METGHIAHAAAGVAVLVALSWALSERPRDVRWRIVVPGLALQALLAAALLLVPRLRGGVSKVPAADLSPRSKLLMTYALCGFANFGSLGIMIGGMGVMVPERRAEVISLGMKSIAAGAIATCMTAAVVGFFI